MKTLDYLIIGTTTSDVVNDGRMLGGTVSYAAPVVRQFGHNLRILTSFNPEDSVPAPLFDLGEVELVPAEHTPTFSNIYSESGRLQLIHETARDLTIDMLPESWASSKLVHLAPLADDVDYKFASQFPDATVMLTPQGYMRQWGEDSVVKFKQFMDQGVLSAIDILVLSKQDIIEAPDLEYEFPKYTKHVVVTDGENGGIYYHNGDKIPYTAYSVEELEPTGAGDVFAGALLASLPLVKHDMPAALKVAARLAALAVTVKGAKIPVTKQYIDDLVQEATSNND